MADALVELLNSLGYQPVFLPRTGVTPPELYNYVDGRLVRRGPLRDYLPAAAELQPTRGTLADISHRQCTGKKTKAAVAFLEKALKCLGIPAVPKIDLSFARQSEIAFSFADVSYRAVDPSRLDHVLRGIDLGAIPQAYAEDGLHVAYEYAYASRLLMIRADGHAFDATLLGSLGNYLDLGPSGQVAVQDSTTISFTSDAAGTVAFAYKAGRLERAADRWEFFPEEVTRGLEDAPAPYVAEAGRVLEVVE
jgi:hypothetical protein